MNRYRFGSLALWQGSEWRLIAQIVAPADRASTIVSRSGHLPGIEVPVESLAARVWDAQLQAWIVPALRASDRVTA